MYAKYLNFLIYGAPTLGLLCVEQWYDFKSNVVGKNV